MAYQLRRFTDEQIERANRVDILEYARSQGLHLKKHDKSSYQVLGYKSGFYITPSKNAWYRFGHEEGGGVVKLCMWLENKTYVEAVKTLLNEDMEPIRHRSDWKPEPDIPKEFHLPEPNNTYRHVFAYLTQTRGIDAGIVKTMVDKKLLYENTKRSCVFVGLDKEGIARHAAVRSTNTLGKAFKQDVAGSQKKYSFSITGTSGTLNVFEAPIDVLSYMSLQKRYGKQINDSYLSLGGVEDRALERFLQDNKDIEKIRICTDNDEAGEKAVARIYEKYGQDYKVTRHRPTDKDFNADLVAIRQQEQMKQQEKNQNEEQPAQPKETDRWQLTDKSGADQDVIKWLVAAKKEITTDLYAVEGHYVKNAVDGDNTQLMICDNPDEIAAHVSYERQFYRNNPQYLDDPDYLNKPVSVSKHYAAYKDINSLQNYIAGHPEITHVFICTSRTDAGTRQAAEIRDLCKGMGLKCDQYLPPEGENYAQCLAKERLKEAVNNAVEQALEQPQPMETVMGMEM